MNHMRNHVISHMISHPMSHMIRMMANRRDCPDLGAIVSYLLDDRCDCPPTDDLKCVSTGKEKHEKGKIEFCRLLINGHKICMCTIYLNLTSSYGRLDHEDWCTHRSTLATWNIERRQLNPNKPDTSVDISACLMCIQFHPKKPSWIVGATFNGNLF